MKKFLTVLVACVFVFSVAGCEKVEGKYKEGTYNAEVVDPYNNEGNIASAKLVVNSNGEIESLYLDTTYTTSDGVKTTKKALGDDYNMKKYYPEAAGEWYEQVEKLEAAVVNAQGLGDITVNDEGYTDAVSGCTIKVDALVEVIEDVLNQAKK